MCWLARAKNWRTVRGRASRRALSSRSTTAPSSSSACRFNGRLRQARITPVQERGAEQVQSADGPVEQVPGRSARRANPPPARRGSAATTAVVCSSLIISSLCLVSQALDRQALHPL